MNSPSILVPPGTAGSEQNLLLFRIYLIYRTVLSVVFLLLITMPATRQLVGAQNPALYIAVSSIFLFSNIALLGVVATRWQSSNAKLVLLFGVDIVCITLLSDASGGMSSGLPLLLAVTVASSAVLISNRTVATLVAALTVLAVLGDTLRLISIGDAGIKALFPAGLLGLLFFVVSGMVQLVALRLGRVEALASERATDIYRLQRLNEQIVQNMQTGILLVDSQNRARILNAAAGRLLDPSRPIALEQGRPLTDYSRELTDRIERFRRNDQQIGSPFEAGGDGAEVVAKFHALEGSDEDQVLVFLDDYRPVAAYAQSLKLSSLGRLAASIAHEIRNPLGAISHASQLLNESPTLEKDDRRMVDMVLTNSQRVNDIVESVLQISRREPPQLQTVILADWISGYYERYLSGRDNPGQLNIEYVDPTAKVLVDPEHLQRILDNLVDNAMRHSELATGERTAEFRVRVNRRKRECVMDVYDDGQGVNQADVPRLFEPFFTRSQGGSGLGLYLCRELCELNQGRIGYLPTTEGRSRFQITIEQQE
ncbi:HAMP domain-containing sensor histidine kinase [Congregibacter variabilis]|uniref:histidine kinase n=1 Tax=Congregibacter variabilis TaxID=3081200 RepID=A0ABZ0I360_9GAMM|nr:HAMP domain-containing sensor histidine kinase [Congregibacter sp. IMCC43200]